MRKTIIGLITTQLLLVSLNVGADSKLQTSNKRLINSHITIAKRYENVSHLKASEVVEMDKSDVVIFDVREKREYAVSHLENAIWIDPSIDTSTFFKKFSQQIADKTVILYCSVGARSSKLAAELLDENDELSIYNLENGIFGWHNESRPLFSSVDSTEYVHPYNRSWGRLINRKELSRYKTEDSTSN